MNNYHPCKIVAFFTENYPSTAKDNTKLTFLILHMYSDDFQFNKLNDFLKICFSSFPNGN